MEAEITMSSKQKLLAVIEEVGRDVKVFTDPAVMTEKSESHVEAQPELNNKVEAADDTDEFYEFTELDYARIMRSKKEEKNLKTKRLRDAEMKAAMQRISKAVIRTRFPDGLYVEAEFQPADLVGDLKQFLKSCIASPDIPFILYTTPPRKPITDDSLTLYAAGLAPGAIVHFSQDCSKSEDADSQHSIGLYLKESIIAIKDLHLDSQTRVEKEQEGEKAKREIKSTEIASREGIHTEPKSRASAGKPKWFKPR